MMNSSDRLQALSCLSIQHTLTEGRMDGWMDGWMDGCIVVMMMLLVIVYRYFNKA